MVAMITQSTAFEDTGVFLMARITGNDGVNIVQADVTSIDCTITNVQTGAAATPTITVSSVVFNTLQSGSRWTVDTTGYNFGHTITAASLPNPETTYRVEYKFTPASGEVYHVVFEIHTKKLWRS